MIKRIAIALATVAALTGSASAMDTMDIMKLPAKDQAALATILAIYDLKCDNALSARMTTVKKLLVLQQAYSAKQIKVAIKEQAALINVIGQRGWCELGDGKFSD